MDSSDDEFFSPNVKSTNLANIFQGLDVGSNDYNSQLMFSAPKQPKSQRPTEKSRSNELKTKEANNSQSSKNTRKIIDPPEHKNSRKIGSSQESKNFVKHFQEISNLPSFQEITNLPDIQNSQDRKSSQAEFKTNQNLKNQEIKIFARENSSTSALDTNKNSINTKLDHLNIESKNVKRDIENLNIAKDSGSNNFSSNSNTEQIFNVNQSIPSNQRHIDNNHKYNENNKPNEEKNVNIDSLHKNVESNENNKHINKINENLKKYKSIDNKSSDELNIANNSAHEKNTTKANNSISANLDVLDKLLSLDEKLSKLCKHLLPTEQSTNSKETQSDPTGENVQISKLEHELAELRFRLDNRNSAFKKILKHEMNQMYQDILGNLETQTEEGKIPENATKKIIASKIKSCTYRILGSLEEVELEEKNS